MSVQVCNAGQKAKQLHPLAQNFTETGKQGKL